MEVTQRIDDELRVFGFTENQILGFMFHLGFTVDQNANYIGVYGINGNEMGLMKNKPSTYLLDSDYEPDDTELLDDTDLIRSCYYTFAKINQEAWHKEETPLSNYINVGAQYLFTGEVNETLWEACSKEKYNAATIDKGYLLFFEILGQDLEENDIKNIADCIWFGKNLALYSAFDDRKSYSFVVDKINTLMSPYLKMMLNYPIQYELNKETYNRQDIFSNIFQSTLKLQSTKLIRDRFLEWMQEKMLDENGILSEEFTFNIDNPGLDYALMSEYGFQFKNSLNSIDYETIFNAGNVYKLIEFEGKDIDLRTYFSIIAQIMNMQFGYDVTNKEWPNYGIFLQFNAFFFIQAMRYSVYPNQLIEE